MSNKSKWSHIKCDYICEDEDDMFWRVDAWRTNDENEEGKVIAYIDDLTGRVVYADPEARFDKVAQAVIKEKVSEIKKKPILADYWKGELSLQCRTAKGILVATAEGGGEDDRHADAMYIGIIPDPEKKETYTDLLFAKVGRDENAPVELTFCELDATSETTIEAEDTIRLDGTGETIQFTWNDERFE